MWLVWVIPSVCLVVQSGPTLCDPMNCSPPGSSVHVDSAGKFLAGVGCRALLQRNLPNPGIEPRYPALRADSLLSEPPGVKLQSSAVKAQSPNHWATREFPMHPLDSSE